MRAHGRTVMAVVGLALLLVTPAWAGHPQTREGFWLSLGGGYGSADAECDGCGSGERQSDFTGILKLGGTINSRFLVGVETNVWTREDGGVRLNLGTITGAVYFYPAETSGFFLKGGLGTAFATTDFEGERINGAGFGWLVGLGYDLRLGTSFSLTPSASYYLGSPGTLKLNSLPVFTGWKQNIFDFTLSFTFH